MLDHIALKLDREGIKEGENCKRGKGGAIVQRSRGDYFKYFRQKGVDNSREVINRGKAIIQENTVFIMCNSTQTNDFYLCLSLLKQLCLALHGSVENSKIITLSSRSTVDLIARYNRPEQVSALHDYANSDSKYGHAKEK